MKSGLERLQDRGIIPKDIITPWEDRILNGIANAVCDLLDHQDKIEGHMDNPDHPEEEKPLTTEWYCAVKQEILPVRNETEFTTRVHEYLVLESCSHSPVGTKMWLAKDNIATLGPAIRIAKIQVTEIKEQ